MNAIRIGFIWFRWFRWLLSRNLAIQTEEGWKQLHGGLFKKYVLTQESGMKKSTLIFQIPSKGWAFWFPEKNILKEFHVQNLNHPPERNNKV